MEGEVAAFGKYCRSRLTVFSLVPKVPIALRFRFPMIKSPSVRLSTAREGRVWLRSPCVKSLTGNVRPPLGSALVPDRGHCDVWAADHRHERSYVGGKREGGGAEFGFELPVFQTAD
jgi:hypothetical protein